MSNLSVRLKELRGSTSQAEMAKGIGIPQQAWARYEKGIVAPNAETLYNICRVHACSANWLLGLPEHGGGISVNAVNSTSAIAIGGGNAITNPLGDAPGCSKCPYKKKLKTILKALDK